MFQGLLRRRINPLLRRGLSALPAVALLMIGLDPVRLLVLSQVALALGLPLALIALLRASRSRAVMGAQRVSAAQAALLTGIIAVVVALDGLLLVLSVG